MRSKLVSAEHGREHASPEIEVQKACLLSCFMLLFPL